MAKIEEILANEDFGSIVGNLCVDTIDRRETREYMDEYNGSRNRRTTSVGFREPKKVAVYSDTEVETDPDTNEESPKRLEDKTIQVAKIVTNIPKKIVRTAAAFLFGGKMTLSADDTNDGFNEFKKVYERKLKMQSVLRRFARIVLSETKGAIIFYPVVTTQNEKKISTLKVKMLSTPKDSNETCEFYPHFDDDDDMDGFIHRYVADIEGRSCECVKIYTKELVISAKNAGRGWEVRKDKNLFGKIPVVYAEVDRPEWEDVAGLIDAYEVRLSRVSDTNDYFAEPILKTYGLSNLPNKETVGKELNFSMEVDSDTGTTYHGDADYLAWQQSIDSIKEELTRDKNEIYSGSSTPDLSFDNLTSIGNLSGVARKFMTIDATIKASENMEVFGPVVQRTISIVSAGIANITNTGLARELEDNYIEATFGTILPEDVAEELQNLALANGNKPFNAQQTIVARSPYTKDAEEEVKLLKMEEKESAQNNILPGMNFSAEE